MSMTFTSVTPTLQMFKNFQFDKLFIDNPYPLTGLRLLQIGDISTKAGYTLPQHAQQCNEITIIVSGSGTHVIDGASYVMKPGDVLIIPKDSLHNAQTSFEDPFRFFYLGFDILEEALSDPTFHEFNQMLVPRGRLLGGAEEIIPFFEGAFSEFVNLNEYSRSMTDGFVHQIITSLCRLSKGKTPTQYYPAADDSPQQSLVYAVVRYIDQNMDQISSLSELGNQLGYTYPYLSDIFSKELGITIHQYYDKKRFEAAIRYLRDSHYSVTAIAHRLHYSSLHSFSKAFHKKFGVSPTNYHALFHNEDEETPL